jgi:hypothetical protein
MTIRTSQGSLDHSLDHRRRPPAFAADCRAVLPVRACDAMRCVAGAGLLLLGCNQIYGISATQSWDAPVDVIADLPHVSLTWQIAATAPSGEPAAALDYPPFAATSAPTVRIAPIDGAFQAAAYSSDADKPGWIEIPRNYFTEKDATSHNKPWRLEYTLPGGKAHEVQWTPQDKLGHLVVPMVGRLDRGSVPIGGGYTATPSNPPASYTYPRVFTTGLWTDGVADPPASGAPIDYDFSNAQSLSGGKGGPDPAQGDRAIVVDFVIDGAGCRIATGSAALTSVALAPGAHTAQSVTWDATTAVVSSDPITTAFIQRLTDVLGPLHGSFNGSLSLQLLGITANAGFPGLTGTSSSLLLPIPVMQTLLQCPYNANPLPRAAQIALLASFPHVLHVQMIDSRSVLGVSLNSGLETVIATTGAGGFKIVFPAPMATQIKLATPTKGTLDLSGAADQLAAGPVGASSGSFTLSFTPEAGTDLRADYHDVLLHRITVDGLTTERIYTSTAPSVRIDGAFLVPGSDYVLEIRTYKGHVMAPLGDFAPVDYPYGAAIVFTRTFTTS